MRDVVVVHPGVQHSGQLAADLDAAGRLDALLTRMQFGDSPSGILGRVAHRLPRRQIPGLDDELIRRLGWWGEVVYRAVDRSPARRYSGLVHALSARDFNRRVLRALPATARVVVGTDTASREVFEALRERRPEVVRILDVSHPLDVAVQPMIAADAKRFGLRVEDYDDYHPGPPLQQLDEIATADAILVASSFSASTLIGAGVPAEGIFVVPYGLREVDRRALTSPRSPQGGTLRLLSLGAMSERKGMTLLLRAMLRLEAAGAPVRLTIAGRPAGAYRLPDKLPTNVEYVGSPDPRGVADLYSSSDVLVLPSMCEGFGRTILEAFAAGCSVIATDRSGAPDILAAVPHAPLTVVPTESREDLDAVILDHWENRAKRLDVEAARLTAREFSAERYVLSLARAMSAAQPLPPRGHSR